LECFTFYVFVAEISSDSSRQQDVIPKNCHLLFKNVEQRAIQPASVVSSQPLGMNNTKRSPEANATTEDPEETSSGSALSPEEIETKILPTSESMFFQMFCPFFSAFDFIVWIALHFMFLLQKFLLI